MEHTADANTGEGQPVGVEDDDQLPADTSTLSSVSPRPKVDHTVEAGRQPSSPTDSNEGRSVGHNRETHDAGDTATGSVYAPETMADTTVAAVRNEKGLVSQVVADAKASPHPDSASSISNVSSPLQSGFSSSASLQMSDVSSSSMAGIGRLFDGYRAPGHASTDDDSAVPSLASRPSFSDSTPPSPARAPSRVRREIPRYPSQSFAALSNHAHSPYHRSLPNWNSYASQISFQSAGAGEQPVDRQSVSSGDRTVGSTPAHSPSWFGPSTSKYPTTGDDSEDGYYGPLLVHRTHLQAPKESVAAFLSSLPLSTRTKAR